MYDYENSFLEFMVKHERTNNELMTPVIGVSGMIFLVFLLSGVCFAYLPAFAPYLTVTFLFVFFNLAKALLQRANLEFEYILTEGELDIDKIINRNSRKRVITFKCSDIIFMGKIGDSLEEYKAFLATKPRKILANGPIVSEATYYAILPSAKGKTLVLFDPPEKLVEAMQRYNKDNINL